MNDRSDHRDRDDAKLERALSRLPDGEPDEGFRERLRESFVEGRIARADTGRRRRRILPLAAAAVALAAALGVWLIPDREPAFEVFAHSGSGTIEIDGEAVPVADTARIGELLAPGVEVRVPTTATLDLVLAKVGLFELTGGTTMTLPGIREGVAGRLETGEIRFASGPAFSGAEMEFTTPEGIVRVTGTLFSLQRGEGGTCVCVLEGVVSVGRVEEDMEKIPPGRRKVMGVDGGTSISPVVPPHREGVLDFLDRAGERFPRK